MVESKVNVFIGRKEDSVELTEKKNQQKMYLLHMLRVEVYHI